MSDQLYSLPHTCKSALNFEGKDSIKLANDQTVQVEGTAHVKMFSQGEQHTILVYILKQTSHPFIMFLKRFLMSDVQSVLQYLLNVKW